MFKQALVLSKDTIGLIDQHSALHVIPNPHRRLLLTHNLLVTGGQDKLVKVWPITELGVAKDPFYSMSLPKKIKRIVQVGNEFLVSDKHGDIYAITEQELQQGSTATVKKTEPKSSNLAIPKFMQTFTIGQQDVLVLADDYSKIKVINARNLDHILNVLVPIEGFLKQIIEAENLLYLLFKVKDENNSDTHFKIFSLAREDLLNDEAQFKLLFPLAPAHQFISQSERVRIALGPNKDLLIIHQDILAVSIKRLHDLSQVHQLLNTELKDVYGVNNQFLVVGQTSLPQSNTNQLVAGVPLIVEDILLHLIA